MYAAQALQLDITAPVKGKVAGAVDEGLEQGGDEDLPAAGLRRDARGENNVLAEEVLFPGRSFLFDRLAGVQAHAHADRFLRALVPFGQGELDRDGAVDGFAGRLKGNHEAVTLVLDLEATVLTDLGTDDGVVVADDFHELLVAEAVCHLG